MACSSSMLLLRCPPIGIVINRIANRSNLSIVLCIENRRNIGFVNRLNKAANIMTQNFAQDSGDLHSPRAWVCCYALAALRE